MPEKAMDFAKLRRDAAGARLRAFQALHNAGGGHFGGVLSEIEILTVLYGSVLRIDPKDPTWPERDIFLLSKGHGAVGLAAFPAAVATPSLHGQERPRYTFSIEIVEGRDTPCGAGHKPGDRFTYPDEAGRI